MISPCKGIKWGLRGINLILTEFGWASVDKLDIVSNQDTCYSLPMHIDLLPNELWETLNTKVSANLNLGADTTVRVSKGLATSVHEVVASMAQFYSHKRSAAYVKGATHAFLGVLPGLYKEAFQIQVIPTQDMASVTWIENLKKDTNFVLYPEDHPITGEIYPWQEIDQKLNELKIFSIRAPG
jgi:hypothetical protein